VQITRRDDGGASTKFVFPSGESAFVRLDALDQVTVWDDEGNESQVDCRRATDEQVAEFVRRRNRLPREQT
jgi:hypothetical protein